MEINLPTRKNVNLDLAAIALKVNTRPTLSEGLVIFTQKRDKPCWAAGEEDRVNMQKDRTGE